MKHRPSLNIYKHKQSENLVIINFATRPVYGGSVGWGPTVHLTMDQVREHGAEVILDNLRGFAERDGSQGSESQKLPREKQNKFNREHKLVSVRQESPSRLVLTPMHPAHPSGFAGDQKDEIQINLPCLVEEFVGKLNIAFEKAG